MSAPHSSYMPRQAREASNKIMDIQSRIARSDTANLIAAPGTEIPRSLSLFDGDELWIGKRPSLSYQHACDLCAIEAQRSERPTAVITGSRFLARELLQRLSDRPVYLVTPDFQHAMLMTGPNRGPSNLESLAEQIGCVIWAEPSQSDKEQILQRIQTMLAADGVLVVMGSGLLTHMSKARSQHGAGGKTPGIRQIGIWLRQSGFRIQAQYGFFGIASILWSIMAQILERLGREELADRYHFRMRANYVVDGKWAAFAFLSVIIAQGWRMNEIEPNST